MFYAITTQVGDERSLATARVDPTINRGSTTLDRDWPTNTQKQAVAVPVCATSPSNRRGNLVDERNEFLHLKGLLKNRHMWVTFSKWGKGAFCRSGKQNRRDHAGACDPQRLHDIDP